MKQIIEGMTFLLKQFGAELREIAFHLEAFTDACEEIASIDIEKTVDDTNTNHPDVNGRTPS